MTYRITILARGGEQLVCLGSEATLEEMRQAHALGDGYDIWPREGTTVEYQWPAGQMQIRWSDVVILAWEEVSHG